MTYLLRWAGLGVMVPQVIFMSHQWTAFAEPDHDGARPSLSCFSRALKPCLQRNCRGKQYEQMVMAVEEVMKKWKWQETTTYVWLDYSSIPQRLRSGLVLKTYYVFFARPAKERSVKCAGIIH